MVQRSILRAVRAQHWANPAGGRLGSLLKPLGILLEPSCTLPLLQCEAVLWAGGTMGLGDALNPPGSHSLELNPN